MKRIALPGRITYSSDPKNINSLTVISLFVTIKPHEVSHEAFFVPVNRPIFYQPTSAYPGGGRNLAIPFCRRRHFGIAHAHSQANIKDIIYTDKFHFVWSSVVVCRCYYSVYSDAGHATGTNTRMDFPRP